MSKRARFETEDGLVILSRNTCTIYYKQGTVKEYSTEGGVDPVRKVGDMLRIPLHGGGFLNFKVLKTPAMLKRESLKLYAPVELKRLQGKGDVDVIAAFRARYNAYLPRERTPHRDR